MCDCGTRAGKCGAGRLIDRSGSTERSTGCVDSLSNGAVGFVLGQVIFRSSRRRGGNDRAIPAADGVINGCYPKNVGNLRVIDPSGGDNCRPSEIPMSWSQRERDRRAIRTAGAEGRYRRDRATGPEGRHRRDRAAGPKGTPAPTGATGRKGRRATPARPGRRVRGLKRATPARPGRQVHRAGRAARSLGQNCRSPIRRVRRTRPSRALIATRISSAAT